MESINELAKRVHENAKSKGFFDKERNIGEMLALIHSEVSEALEADRRNRMSKRNIKVVNGWIHNDDFKTYFIKHVKDSFEDELADIIIRVMDLAAYRNIDLEEHIKAKMRFNSLREHKHNVKY